MLKRYSSLCLPLLAASLLLLPQFATPSQAKTSKKKKRASIYGEFVSDLKLKRVRQISSKVDCDVRRAVDAAFQIDISLEKPKSAYIARFPETTLRRRGNASSRRVHVETGDNFDIRREYTTRLQRGRRVHLDEVISQVNGKKLKPVCRYKFIGSLRNR